MQSICTVNQLLHSSILAIFDFLHVNLHITPWGCNCLRIESGYSGKTDHIIFLQNSKLDNFNLVVMLSSPPGSVGGRRQFIRPRRWRRADTSHQKVIVKWLQLIPFNPGCFWESRKLTLYIRKLGPYEANKEKQIDKLITLRRIHSILHMSVMLTSASVESQ